MRLLAPAGAVAAVLCTAAAAGAADNDYVVRTFTEPASRGLAVSPPVDDLVAVSRARALVPHAWRPRGSTGFLTGHGHCFYRVKFTVRSRPDAPGDAADRVAAALPAKAPAFVLDSGERRSGAFRVVRTPVQAAVRVDAQWSGVLTRRKDIAPSGQVVWTDLTVVAQSRPGDECHSGTYRDVLAPQISDALATARATLRFVKKPA